MLTLSDIQKLNNKGNVIPLHKRIPADLDTPVSAYLKLRGRSKQSFLLESVEGGETLARYSFLGFNPFLVIEGTNDGVTLIQNRKRRTIEVSPIEFVKELFEQYKPVPLHDLPRFTGGAVGYFGYDTIRWIEELPDNNPDLIGLPDLRLGLFREVVAFDHSKQEIVIIANILHDKGKKGLKQKYADARKAIHDMETRLKKPLPKQKPLPKGKRTRLEPHYTRKEFETMVRRAKKYIYEGDIFQVVISQTWHVDSKRDALSVYRRLRRINPSPYMFLLTFGDDAVVGASPEMLVRIENQRIENRPIAGTRPRGKDAAEDKALELDMLNDEKEVAEHTMLLDLGRNDIGRVSRPGGVKVEQQMMVERYSHVMHLVSIVSGQLKKEIGAIEGHYACFPAGTLSGAPKVRAMEIIDELEKERRGVYAGSIGYIDFWGNLDACVAIRLLVKRKNRYVIQAGAGIVADSKPAREFRESENKAHAMVEAVIGDDYI